MLAASRYAMLSVAYSRLVMLAILSRMAWYSPILRPWNCTRLLAYSIDPAMAVFMVPVRAAPMPKRPLLRMPMATCRRGGQTQGQAEVACSRKVQGSAQQHTGAAAPPRARKLAQHAVAGDGQPVSEWQHSGTHLEAVPGLQQHVLNGHLAVVEEHLGGGGAPGERAGQEGWERECAAV
jgi:hypothetical protein